MNQAPTREDMAHAHAQLFFSNVTIAGPEDSPEIRPIINDIGLKALSDLNQMGDALFLQAVSESEFRDLFTSMYALYFAGDDKNKTEQFYRQDYRLLFYSILAKPGFLDRFLHHEYMPPFPENLDDSEAKQLAGFVFKALERATPAQAENILTAPYALSALLHTSEMDNVRNYINRLPDEVSNRILSDPNVIEVINSLDLNIQTDTDDADQSDIKFDDDVIRAMEAELAGLCVPEMPEAAKTQNSDQGAEDPQTPPQEEGHDPIPWLREQALRRKSGQKSAPASTQQDQVGDLSSVVPTGSTDTQEKTATVAKRPSMFQGLAQRFRNFGKRRKVLRGPRKPAVPTLHLKPNHGGEDVAQPTERVLSARPASIAMTEAAPTPPTPVPEASVPEMPADLNPASGSKIVSIATGFEVLETPEQSVHTPIAVTAPGYNVEMAMPPSKRPVCFNGHGRVNGARPAQAAQKKAQPKTPYIPGYTDKPVPKL